MASNLGLGDKAVFAKPKTVPIPPKLASLSTLELGEVASETPDNTSVKASLYVVLISWDASISTKIEPVIVEPKSYFSYISSIVHC